MPITCKLQKVVNSLLRLDPLIGKMHYTDDIHELLLEASEFVNVVNALSNRDKYSVWQEFFILKTPWSVNS